MVPGCDGSGDTFTFKLLTELLPQELLAFTVIVPPDAPTTALIELLEELPVQPLGKVQVYDVAPDTDETL